MRELLRVHEDVITVPEVIGKLAGEYISEGNQVERLSSMNFKIVLQGGWVHIYWEEGCIWQEIIEEKEEKNTIKPAKELADAKPTKNENEQVAHKENLPVPEDDMEEAADNRGQQEVKQSPNKADILDELVTEIVPLLVKGAAKALQIPKYGGLEFSAMLLEEAVKYKKLYPRAFTAQDRARCKSVRELQQRRDACNEKIGEFTSYEKCYRDNAGGRSG